MADLHQILTQNQNTIVSTKTQERINAPLSKDDGLAREHELFLKLLIEKLEKGELDPLNPATLFNRAVYDKLPEKEQEETSLTAVNAMGVIRQLYRLWKLDRKETFQVQNLVDTVFQMKSKFEEKYGDVFII